MRHCTSVYSVTSTEAYVSLRERWRNDHEQRFPVRKSFSTGSVSFNCAFGGQEREKQFLHPALNYKLAHGSIEDPSRSRFPSSSFFFHVPRVRVRFTRYFFRFFCFASARIVPVKNVTARRSFHPENRKTTRRIGGRALLELSLAELLSG